MQKLLQEATYMVNHSPVVTFLWNNKINWPVQFVSDNVFELFGYSAEAFTSGEVMYADVIHPDDLQRVADEVSAYEKKEQDFSHKIYRIVGKSGETKWIDDKTFIRRGEDGRITHYEGVVYDVTSRIKMRIALKESEARYRNIFQTTAVSIWEEDFSELKQAIDALKAAGVVNFRAYLNEHPEFINQAVGMVKILKVNEATLKMYGAQNKDELVATLSQTFVTETFAIFREELIALAEGHTHFTTEAITQTLQGKRIDILITITLPAPDESWDNVAVSMIDITERKRAEEALIESEKKFRTLTVSSPIGMFLDDAQGNAIYTNEKCAELIGMPVEDSLNWNWLQAVHPDDQDRVQTEWKKAVRNGTEFHQEYRWVHKDGKIIWTVGDIVPVKSNDGEVSVYIGTLTDITERKQTEEKLKQYHESLETLVAERTAELQQRVAEVETLNNEMLNLLTDLQNANKQISLTAQQLKSSNDELESFAYSVSHDLRAPLRHINGFVSMLKKRERERLDEKSTHYLDVISSAADKMGHLIDDLLAFSRTGRQSLVTQPVDVYRLVTLLKQEAMAEVTDRNIVWDIEPLPTVTADANMLRLVWVNLLENAVKYSAPRQEAHIQIGVAPSERDDEITFFVQDNGVGFDERYVDKLFGVFQRLHRDNEFEGIGIGLATVRRIIHRHNGRTWAKGKIDEGATFYFTLPHTRLMKKTR